MVSVCGQNQQLPDPASQFLCWGGQAGQPTRNLGESLWFQVSHMEMLVIALL